MSASPTRHNARAAVLGRARFILFLLKQLSTTIPVWIERSRQRRALGELVDRKDHLLADVGLSVETSGAQVLDASGAYVTPGFIDMHTHLDPSLFWDRGCDPMPHHGVTTVLIGNCSLGLVPVRPDLVDEVSKLFCYIEDMPPGSATPSTETRSAQEAPRCTRHPCSGTRSCGSS